MKVTIEEDFDHIENCARLWLKEMLRMSECEYKDTSDRAFWDNLAFHCDGILDLNFKWVDDESD